jgi:hypothetical protein
MKIPIVLAITAVFSGTAFSQAAGNFETPPDEAPDSSLTASEVSGSGFHIKDPVRNDGLMHRYIVESRFGDFPAYGHAALTARLREVAALQAIANTKDSDVVLKAVGRGAKENVDTVVQVVKNPVGMVFGIPKGISHLFSGYRAEAQETGAKAREAVHPASSGPQASVATRITQESGQLAKQYADRYLGLSAAERRWYAELGVDPYTNNEVLRKSLKRLVKVDAATSLGLRFAPIGIPFAGEARRALDVIYNENPAVLRKRRHGALVGFGLTPEDVKQFENTLLLNPTRQTLLVNDMEALNGVEGRAELLRHAMSVTTEEEIEVFLRSTTLLVRAHSRQPLIRVLAGLRVPAAQRKDGHVMVFGAFDAIYWTPDVAGYAEVLRAAMPADATGREVWIGGMVSSRARAELEHLGWTVHDHAEQALPPSPAVASQSIEGH